MCIWIILLLCTYATIPIGTLAVLIVWTGYWIYPLVSVRSSSSSSGLPTTLDLVCPCHQLHPLPVNVTNHVQVILPHGTLITTLSVTHRMESLRWIRSFVRIYPHLRTVILHMHHPCTYERTKRYRDHVTYEQARTQTSKLLRSMVPHVDVQLALK
jgi:hypothetical protein